MQISEMLFDHSLFSTHVLIQKKEYFDYLMDLYELFPKVK